MTVKRVLYYLEPSVELGMPLFRYSTFKSKILPEARELKKYSSDLDIGIIIGEQLVTKAKQEGLDLSCFNVYAMSPQDVEDITGDYLSSSLKWYDGSYDYNMINQFSNLIKDVVSGFEPDIVISYEAATPFLKHTFPNSLNLNVMFGAFSRAPFPSHSR